MNRNRVTFRNSRDLQLVGNFFPASSHSVIIMCHGFTSDKSSKGRFDRFAQVFQGMGYNVLAFDFSGCGESDDDSLTVAKMVDDLQAAVAYVKREGFTRIALYGHSLGSRVCLSGYTPEIATMVLSGAGTGPVSYNWDEIYTAEQMKELAETGFLTEHRENGPRKTLVIEQQMLRDFEEFSQKELLTHVKCPVLIIHGNAGWEEPLLLSVTQQGMQYLPADSRLEIVDGAAHSFMDHLHVVQQMASDWYREHFPPDTK